MNRTFEFEKGIYMNDRVKTLNVEMRFLKTLLVLKK